MINEICKTERPYEKCLEHGAVSLSNTELLAVLLRTGVKGLDVLELAQHLLGPNCGDDGILNIHNLTLEELKSIVEELKTKEVIYDRLRQSSLKNSR